MQTISIILVVFFHSWHEYPGSEQDIIWKIMSILSSFIMPVFIFVSGFLMAYTSQKMLESKNKRYVSNFVIKKLKRLILPYIVLNAAMYFFKILLFKMLFGIDIVFSLSEFGKCFINMEYIPIPYLWFLQLSITLILTYFFVIAMTSRIGIRGLKVDIVLIAVSVAISIWNEFPGIFSLHYSARYCVYFALGIFYAHFQRCVDSFISWTSPWFLVSVFLGWVFMFYAGSISYIFVLLCTVFGIMMIISVTKIIEKHNFTFLDHLTGANFIIFLLSYFFNVASQQGISYFYKMPWYFNTILSIVSGIYGPWLLYRYMQSHRQFRWIRILSLLLGQSYNTGRNKIETDITIKEERTITVSGIGS